MTCLTDWKYKANGCQLCFLCCLQARVSYVWVRDFINLCA
jgi:hypothetical protein